MVFDENISRIQVDTMETIQEIKSISRESKKRKQKEEEQAHERERDTVEISVPHQDIEESTAGKIKVRKPPADPLMDNVGQKLDIIIQ